MTFGMDLSNPLAQNTSPSLVADHKHITIEADRLRTTTLHQPTVADAQSPPILPTHCHSPEIHRITFLILS